MARVVVQRVRAASVTVGSRQTGHIGVGLLVLVGVREGDDEAAIDRLADKVAVLRIFDDAQGKMNLSCADVDGAILAVSQFTLYADVRKGRRPSFIQAAGPELGRALYDRFVQRLRGHGYEVARGEFGAPMLVALENNGPVTIIIDSSEL